MQQRVAMIASVALTWVLVFGTPAWAQPAAAPPTEKFDLSGAIAETEDTLKEALEEAGTGDKKTFIVDVDSDINITEVKAGDIYSGGEKTLFEVTKVVPNGTQGGTIELLRTHGTADPDKRFTRVRGLGPLTIVKRVRLIDYYYAAGWPAHFITALGLFAIVLAANSVWLYRRGRQCPARFVEEGRRLLDEGDVAGLEEAALKRPGLFPLICRALTDRFDSSTETDIRVRAETVAGAHVARLRVPVKLLNFCAVCAPLIGLAGTIYGMIIVFEAVAGAAGAGKAAVLAAGIRLKLLCTLFALMVAIPSLLLFYVFNSRLGNIIAWCELLTEEFMHKIMIIKRQAAASGSGAGNGDQGVEAPLAATPARGGR